MPVFNHHLNRDLIPDDAINVMRPHIFSNPFIIGRDGDRDIVLKKYRRHLWDIVSNGVVSLEYLASLHKANLLCCCSPNPCHADIILEAAEWACGQLSADNN